jgi:uncharacterized protein (DUF1800 family)
MSQPSVQADRRTTASPIARAFALAVLALGCATSAVDALAQSLQAAVGVYRPGISRFFVDGNYDLVADLSVAFGQSGDVALLGDIRGDGARHPVVFRNGQWLVDRNRDGTSELTVTFGAAGDKPLIADFDKDGIDDLVLYRNGVWYISSGGTGTATYAYGFGGGATDIPLLADIDGDGMLDLIIYRAGVWFASTRRDGVADRVFAFGGGPNDIPMAFDYNGDGIADLVIFRDGVWYVSTARNGVVNASFQLGIAGDKPLYFGKGVASTPRLDAARLLYQGTFGPTEAEITRVQTLGVAGWVDAQLAAPKSTFTAMPWWPTGRPSTSTNPLCTFPNYLTSSYSPTAPCNCSDATGFNRCQRDVYTNYRVQNEFLTKALTAPDQLRLRTAWALSQIIVTSNMQDPLAYPMRDYFQMLTDNAFGNFQELLLRVTASPWMGNYLDMVNNNGSPAQLAAGRLPNENYARELLQLFSIGLWELRDDGTQLLDAQGKPIPTYDQDEIMELARALTGWTYYPLTNLGQTVRWNAPVNYLVNMIPIEGPLNGTGTVNYHDVTAKALMGYTFPAGGRAETEINMAVALVAQHPNTAPFMSKQLIQQLVTSNPTPAYVQRVSAVWNNNGSGIRGDLKSVVKAILTDPEARAPRNPVRTKFGKLKEPVLYVTSLLRQLGISSDGVALRTPLSNMAQNVFNSPTVFNYYNAEYVVPGTNLAGPAFEIFDATLYFQRVNWAYNLLYSGTCDTGAPWSPVLCGPAPDTTVSGSTGTKIDWTMAKAYADNPTALVSYVDNVLLFGTMPVGMRNSIVKAVTAVTVSTPSTQQQRLDRARMAVYLTAISPKFQVEF